MEEKEFTIDFLTLIEILKKGKLIIILCGGLFALIAAIWVINKPNEFTSSTSVMPEIESSDSGRLGGFAGLASLAGVDLSSISSSDAIRPDLYPSVINNTSFFIYLLDQKVKTTEIDEVNFINFYIQAYGIQIDTTSGSKGFISKLKGFFGVPSKEFTIRKDSTDQLIHMTQYRGEIIEELRNKVIANIDKKSGVITVTVELPDPITAAFVAKISMDYLTEFVTNYRTEKSRQNLNFLAGQLGEAKGKYYSTQSKKANYSDQFQSASIRLQAADIQRERIEADYRVSSTFYTELMKQYESAKMDLQKNTPVFKTLEQPVIPYKKSGPGRSIALVLSSISGLILGTVIVLIRKNNFKRVIVIYTHGSE